MAYASQRQEHLVADVAYDSVHDLYLVVWEQYDASAGYSIQARRIAGSGAVLDAADIPIRTSGANLHTPVTPAVEYSFTSDRFLVVWSETWHPLPVTHGIYGQVVTDAGSLDGMRFPISEGSDEREAPDVAYNRRANRHLVVWQQSAGTNRDVYAQQVHGGGGLFGTPITIAYYTAPTTAPRVAAIPTTPTDEKFLVVWELHYTPTDLDVWGRLVLEDGTPATAFAIAEAGGVNETIPAIAGTEAGLRYLVVWRRSPAATGETIEGRAVSYSGTLLEQRLDVSGVAADQPAVASGPVGDFLVTWQDQLASDPDTDIYGRLVPEPGAGASLGAALPRCAGHPAAEAPLARRHAPRRPPGALGTGCGSPIATRTGARTARRARSSGTSSLTCEASD